MKQNGYKLVTVKTGDGYTGGSLYYLISVCFIFFITLKKELIRHNILEFYFLNGALG